MLDYILILLIALIIETITIIGRFGLKIKSKEIYKKILKKYEIKKLIHVHHLFLGIIAALLGYFISNSFVLNIGLGVALSDVIHHFLVLSLFTGTPEFHVFYKNTNFYSIEHKMEIEAKKILNHLIHFH